MRFNWTATTGVESECENFRLGIAGNARRILRAPSSGERPEQRICHPTGPHPENQTVDTVKRLQLNGPVPGFGTFVHFQ